MSQNRLHPTDRVKVVVSLGSETYIFHGSGFNTIDEAIRTAFDVSPFSNVNIEDCVFTVQNIDTATSARYRVNAGNNVRILPVE